MASSSSGSSHLGVTDNQKRWLVAGIALNKILIPQIRPFVEQDIDKEYNNLKTTHNIHTQSTSGRLQRWPARKFLKYENINGNDAHPKLPGGRYDYSRFDCRVLSHVDFAKLYVENYMAKFNAFDEHCDASAILLLLGGVPVFSPAVQAAAGDVRMARNDWAHCVFSKWDPTKFQQSFIEMEDLVRVMALPAADEGKLLGELKDWETKGIQLCMNSPVDPALLQLVQQNISSLQDDVNNMSVEFNQEKVKVQQELQNVATILKEMKERVQRLEDNQGAVNMRIGKLESLQRNTESRTGQIEGRVDMVENTMGDFQGDANRRFEKVEGLQEITAGRTGEVEGRVDNVENRMDDFQGHAKQRFESLESRAGQVENQVHNLQEKFDDLTVKSQECASCHDSPMPAVNPEKFVELIKREYKGAVLCPFPWCEDDLQLKLSNIFTKLKIVSRTKERSMLTDSTVNMTDVFKQHKECDKPRVVLIEGNPGMGKTTYCQKLAYDWSVGKIPPEASFPEVEMLLLLKCRDINMKTASIEEAIDDQLLPQDADKKEKENFFHFIRSNQSRILLVLDGLDELREDLVQGFLPLIQGKVFANAYLMLTARHEAGMTVRRNCDTLLEIVGYTHDDVECYIKKYFSSHEDQSLANKMIEQLKRDKHLGELSANPFNTALLCLVFEETEGVLPSKRTKLYDDLVSCALRRYFAKKGLSLGDDDPLERCAEQLNQLGKMAFEALLKDQLYFSQDKMKCQTEDFLHLCFLSREPSVSKIRPTPCYAFTHKTFQEYFAAFYLAHQILTGDKGKEALLAQLRPVKNWLVWEFLLTITASKNSEMAVILVSLLCASLHCIRTKKAIDPITDSADVNMDKEICEYKTYDFRGMPAEDLTTEVKGVNDVVIKTLHLIADCEDGGNELKDYQSKMIHELARCLPCHRLQLAPSFRYCLVYSEYLKVASALTNLLLHSDLNELLLVTTEHVFHPKHKLERLNLNNTFLCWFDLEFQIFNALVTLTLHAKAIERILLLSPFLTHLNLCKISVNDEGIEALAECLQTNCTLTHLNLSECRICDSGAQALCKVLQTNCTLTHLSLPKNWISSCGAGALAEALQSNCTLLYLDLSKNRFGDSVAEAFARVLESNCTLTHLDLRQCHSCMFEAKCLLHLSVNDFSDDAQVELIGPLGGSALARALRLNRALTYLNLEFNRIVSGATALREALQTNRFLRRLYLMDNKIGDSGAEALGKALQSNFTLTHLHLQCNFIGDLGAEALATALQSSGTQLTHLDLRYNHIGSSGAISVAKALQSNRTLLRLGLGSQFADGDKIESSVAVAIAKALQSNRTLTHLNLATSDIGDSGVIELAQALQYHNNTLVYLDLTGNPIGWSGTKSLERIDQSNRVLEFGRKIFQRSKVAKVDFPVDFSPLDFLTQTETDRA